MLRIGSKSQRFACDAGHGYRAHRVQLSAVSHRGTFPVPYAVANKDVPPSPCRGVLVDLQIHIKLRDVIAEIAQEGTAVIEDAAAQSRNLSSTIPTWQTAR
jgi:hypothetical protein